MICLVGLLGLMLSGSLVLRFDLEQSLGGQGALAVGLFVFGLMLVFGNMKIAQTLNENTNSTYINNYPEEDVAWRITDLLLLTKRGTLYILGEFMAGVI